MLLLHVSDIHFRHPECLAPTDPDRPFRTLLLNDVRGLLRELSAPLDAILVTGDIAFKASPDEFKAAETWLTQMAQEFGQPRSGIFVVPGNHDVDRSLCGKQIDIRNVQGAIRSRQTIPEKERELRAQLGDSATSHSILKPIESYNAFAAKFDCNLFAPQRTHWSHDLPMDYGVTLRLHGLNSTLLSGYEGKDDDRGTMYLSAYQTAFDPEEGVVNAVLAHHPPDWCCDSDDIEDAITTRTLLQFFGHKHRQRIVQEDRYIRYSAGAVNPDRHEAGWEPGYNLLKLDIRVQGNDRYLSVESHVRALRVGEAHFDYKRPRPGENHHQKLLLIPGHYVQQEQGTVNTGPIDPPPHPSGGALLQEPVMPESVRDRDLVFRFWELSISQRRDIAKALNLLQPGEMQMPEPERYGRALLRAKERGLVEQLAGEISRRERSQ